ncbi:MAG: hypothetical protein R2909_21970 [Gemmatimonadales bacterium]
MTPTDLEERDGVQVPSGAGTPSRFPGETLDALQLGPALELVAEHAAGPLGAARVRARRPATDAAHVAEELATVRELLVLRDRGESVDIPPMPEIGGPLRRLRVSGSVLNGPELVLLRRALQAGRTAAKELSRVAQDAPRAASWVVPLPSRKLDERLEQALDDDGELHDGASPGSPAQDAPSTKPASGWSGSSIRSSRASTPGPCPRAPSRRCATGAT